MLTSHPPPSDGQGHRSPKGAGTLTLGTERERSMFGLPVRVCGCAHNVANPGLGIHLNSFQVLLNRFASLVSQMA